MYNRTERLQKYSSGQFESPWSLSLSVVRSAASSPDFVTQMYLVKYVKTYLLLTWLPWKKKRVISAKLIVHMEERGEFKNCGLKIYLLCQRHVPWAQACLPMGYLGGCTQGCHIRRQLQTASANEKSLRKCHVNRKRNGNHKAKVETRRFSPSDEEPLRVFRQS